MEQFHLRYDVREVIGRGTYSSVYRVVQRNASVSEFAAKVVSKHQRGYNEHEFRVLSALPPHPNLIACHDFFSDDAVDVLIMDLVNDGEELFQLVARCHQSPGAGIARGSSGVNAEADGLDAAAKRGDSRRSSSSSSSSASLCSGMPTAAVAGRRVPDSFSEMEAARCMHQLFAVLAHLHSHGVVHRDVKLENLLYSHQSGTIKLIDFGMSKQVGTDRRSLTTFCGSPNYMSPEILRASRADSPLPSKMGSYGSEVDVWSAGVAMFVMLAGRYPFHDERKVNIHRRIMEGRFVLPPSVSIAPEARDLLCRCFDTNADLRISAKQALSHSWFARFGLTGSTYRDQQPQLADTPTRAAVSPSFSTPIHQTLRAATSSSADAIDLCESAAPDTESF